LPPSADERAGPVMRCFAMTLTTGIAGWCSRTAAAMSTAWRGLGPLQCAAGITTDPQHPKHGLHSLCHAAASLFIEQGFSPKRVQR
jgi:hypothetical protein